MKFVTAAVTRRLDHLARMQRFKQLTLLTGTAMIGLGVVAVSMTLWKEPGSLIGPAFINPKVNLTILPWLPTPLHYRFIGVILFVFGAVLLILGSMQRHRDI